MADLVPYFALGFVGLGGLVHVSVRDSLRLLAPFYYMTPYPLLAFMSLVAGGVALARGRLMVGGALILAVVIFSVSWISNDYYHHTGTGGDGVRVLLWNVARYPFGIEPVARHLRQMKPDVVGLVEGGLTEEQKDKLLRTLPELSVHNLPGNMAFLSRGALDSYRHVNVTGRS